MKRKAILGIALAGMLAFGAGLGTMAWFSDRVTSSDNIIKAADFKITANNLATQEAFEFPKIYPGELGYHGFSIDKSDIEVPVKFEIEAIGEGRLFREGTPIELGILRNYNAEGPEHKQDYQPLEKNEDGKFVLPYTENEKEEFRLIWKWNVEKAESNNFKNDQGKVKLNITATQLPEEAMLSFVWWNDRTNKNQSSANNRVVLSEDTIVIQDNSYFGTAKFEISGNTATLTETKVENLKGNWNLTIHSDTFIQIQKGQDNINITVPGGANQLK